MNECIIWHCWYSFKTNFIINFLKILLEDVDIDKILISGMPASGEINHRYFISSKENDYKIKPLCIMLEKGALI